MIAGYDGEPIPLAYPQLILTNRLTLEGFIVSEHMEVWPAGAEGARHAGRHAASCKSARVGRAGPRAPRPRRSSACLKGRNFGKQLVKLI